MGAPIVDIRGSVGPAGISRPKHKRTYTGFGSQEIKHVEGMLLALSPRKQALDCVL
jgi:starch phosphorylase